MSISELDKANLDKQMRELIVLYAKVKRYIVASEKTGGNKLSMPAINELRNAFDHEMRAQAVLLGLQPVPKASGMTETDYCRSNISKAVGHVYRAGYDALDVISLALVTDIERMCQSVSHTTLVSVISGYSEQVRLPLEKAMQTCDDAKAMKDVESDGAGNLHFSRYEQAITELKAIQEKLYAHLPDLTIIEKENSMTMRRERNFAYVLAVGGIVLGAVVAYVFWRMPPSH